MRYREWHMERKIPPGFHFRERSYKLQTRSSTRMGGEQKESYWAGSLKIVFLLTENAQGSVKKNNTGVKWLLKIFLYVRISRLQFRQAPLVYQGTSDDQEEGKGLNPCNTEPKKTEIFPTSSSFPKMSLTRLLQYLQKCLCNPILTRKP